MSTHGRKEIATVEFKAGALQYLHNTDCLRDAVRNPIERTLLEIRPQIKKFHYRIGRLVVKDWDV